MPSTTQLAQGVPESVTVHRTLRELQALHATAARRDGREFVRVGEDMVQKEVRGSLLPNLQVITMIRLWDG